ncbi:MAG TPA: response regulator transcription factor, partial [Actinomycetota bacterium]|nr:response regulator transcription factor [Actinomycetota bacterium]
MEAPTIRIVLAERHQLFREAVVAALSSEPGFRVEAAVGDGLSAVTAAARHHPDMALLGATIRDYDPLTATAMIREDNPDCRVVLLGGETDDAALVQAVEAGVSAYLPKSSTLDEVVASIRAVHRGEVMIPLGMLGALLTELTGRRREREALHRLTATLTRRECEVLLLLAQGADNDTMAGQLFISPQTARTH